MGFDITVDGVSWVTNKMYLSGTLNVRDGISETTFSEFVGIDQTGNTHRPQEGHEVVVSNDGVNIFVGSVDEILEENLHDDILRYEISATDNNYIAERRVVVGRWVGVDADEVVTDIIDRVLSDEGVTAGNVVAAPAVEDIRGNFDYVSDVLDMVAGEVAYNWKIRPDKTLDFFPINQFPAPWDLDDTTVDRVKKLTFTPTGDRATYRNRQIVRGVEGVTPSFTETIVADKPRRFFELSYPVENLTSIKVDGAEQEGVASAPFVTWFPDGMNFEGEVTRWQWFQGSPDVKRGFSEPVVEQGQTVEFTYQGRGKTAVVVDAKGEQTERATVESGTGIYETVSDGRFESREEALSYGKGQLKKYGNLDPEASYETYRTDLTPGMIQNIDQSLHNLDAVDFLIGRVEYRDSNARDDDFDIVSRIELTSNIAKDGGKWWKDVARGDKSNPTNEVLVLPPDVNMGNINNSDFPGSNIEDSEMNFEEGGVASTFEHVWIFPGVDENNNTIHVSRMHQNTYEIDWSFSLEQIETAGGVDFSSDSPGKWRGVTFIGDARGIPSRPAELVFIKNGRDSSGSSVQEFVFIDVSVKNSITQVDRIYSTHSAGGPFGLAFDGTRLLYRLNTRGKQIRHINLHEVPEGANGETIPGRTRELVLPDGFDRRDLEYGYGFNKGRGDVGVNDNSNAFSQFYKFFDKETLEVTRTISIRNNTNWDGPNDWDSDGNYWRCPRDGRTSPTLSKHDGSDFDNQPLPLLNQIGGKLGQNVRDVGAEK